MDAIAISLAKGTSEQVVDGALAARAIVLAALVNTAVKAGLAVAIGGRKLVRSGHGCRRRDERPRRLGDTSLD